MTAAGGNFFEDFAVGALLRHATPRTVTSGDVALHIALTGSRFALHCADSFARACGLPAAPIDDLLRFHIVFGRSVPDVSLNAVANLGYAECRFGAPVYPGDTLKAVSRVIGKRELSNGKAGIVWVETTGSNQRDETVLGYVRWAMVAKRDAASPAPPARVPALAEAVEAASLTVPRTLNLAGYDFGAAGDSRRWGDVGEGWRIDHVDGMTVEEAEHQMATRLYQNTARVHFDLGHAAAGRFGRRVVYGGHVMSLARALSFNGLANACGIVAVNGGRHTAPVFAGDTVHAWSEVLAKAELPGRRDAGALRLRTIATRNRACGDFPDRDGDGRDHADKVLELDYWVLMPR